MRRINIRHAIADSHFPFGGEFLWPGFWHTEFRFSHTMSAVMLGPISVSIEIQASQNQAAREHLK